MTPNLPQALEAMRTLLANANPEQLNRVVKAAELASDNNLGAITPIVPQKTPTNVSTSPDPMEDSLFW